MSKDDIRKQLDQIERDSWEIHQWVFDDYSGDDELQEMLKKAYNLGIQVAVDNVKMKKKNKFLAAIGYSKFVSKEVIDKKSILKLKL